VDRSAIQRSDRGAINDNNSMIQRSDRGAIKDNNSIVMLLLSWKAQQSWSSPVRIA
jgi:hypothetical protein